MQNAAKQSSPKTATTSGGSDDLRSSNTSNNNNTDVMATAELTSLSANVGEVDMTDDHSVASVGEPLAPASATSDGIDATDSTHPAAVISAAPLSAGYVVSVSTDPK